MDTSISRIIKVSFVTAIKNIPSLFAASILWALTIWIPYINVGTTIALFYGLPLELSEGKVMNPLNIFDGKYRKFMGEFFSICGLMLISLIPAFMFLIIPGIVIAIGWKFATLLLIDKQINPAEALTQSTLYTYGYKWKIFWSTFIIYLIIGIIGCGLTVAIVAAESAIMLIFFSLLLIAIYASIGVSTDGTLYKIFVLERDEQDNMPEIDLV